MKQKTVTSPAYSDSAETIGRIADNFDSEGTIIYNKRNTLREVDADGRRLIVKRYKRPNIFQRIAYTWFQPCKAQRAFDYAGRLKEIGINTPEPAAWIERKKSGMTSEYFFFSEPTSDHAVAELAEEGRPLPADMAQQLAEFIAVMHRKGFMHGDSNLTNILYNQTPEGVFKFSVIDTNRSTWNSGNPTISQRLDNLVRLSHNRCLLADVARRYAVAENINPEEFAQRLMARLDSFENSRRNRQKLKKLLPGHK